MTRPVSAPPAPLELWGGVECTLNRVRDDFHCQLDRSGHALRIDDLDRIAALGVNSLRYPVLWEYNAPRGLTHADWRWSDARLSRLRELGVTPILGLVHHGSGPAHTSLVDRDFPQKLACYARAVAQRYPWAEWYTPVNEPLTTARFSGLYGVWYPHARDPETFKNALLMQCRGVVLAMRAIRRINPAAKLIQTDDLGKTYATPRLQFQADHNNEARWLGWDLLCGRVTPTHPLWAWLTGECRAMPRELLWFAEHPCPPDIMGVNYYVTSERYLDENLADFPERYHGGNGRERYADIELARAVETPTGGLAALLLEAWERYRLPLAITEVHIDSTRDHQLRWLNAVWEAASQARAAGADLRAVTVWALFGSYDWNCLVTACHGYYEPGAYDVRGHRPRATAIARLMQQLGAGSRPDHPVLPGRGWWQRDDRYFCTPRRLATAPPVWSTREKDDTPMRPILITGATGTLGRAFARLCEQRSLDYRLLARTELDIADSDAIERAIERHAPWAIVNAAGYVRVDDAEDDVERCFRENATGPRLLAAACARHGLPLATFSSDLVFDGENDEPYREHDRVAPLNVYGRSKAAAEREVLDRHSGALVIRTSAFFGPWDAHNFVNHVLEALRADRPFVAADDLVISPTYVPDLVHACLDLLIDGENGIVHLSSGQPLTWADFAVQAAHAAGLDAGRVEARSSSTMRFRARRPRYSALASARTPAMPGLADALGRYVTATN